MTERVMEIVIKGKNMTPAAFAAARKELRDLEKGQGDVAASSTSLGHAFKVAGAGLAVAATAAAAVAGAVALAAKEIFDLGVRGSTVVGVRNSFDALARSVGEAGAAMLATTRGATKGLISDLDVMSAVNKGVLLGLPITSKEMQTLSTTAIVLGKAMKVGPTDALNDLITGLGRGSPAILDNLGITVQATEAYAAYGRSVSKSAADLTDSEKKLAVYQAAMSAATIKVEELGGIQLTFGDRVTQANVALSNLTDQLGEGIARSPVLAAGMESLGMAFSRAFGAEQNRLVDLLVAGVNKFAMFLVDAGIYAVELGKVGAQAFGVLMTPIGYLQLGVAQLTTGVVAFAEAFYSVASNLPGVGDKFTALKNVAASMGDQLRTDQGNIQNWIGKTMEMASGHGVVIDTLTGVSRALVTARGEMEAAANSQSLSKAATKDATAALVAHRPAQAAHVALTKEQEKALKAATAAQEKFAASVNNDFYTADFYVPLKAAVKEASQELEELPSSAAIATNGLAKFKEEVHDTGTATEGLGAQLREGLMADLRAVPGTLARAFEGGGNWLGAAKSLGSQFGSTIGTTIGESFKLLGSFGGPIGAAIGSLAGPLIGKIGSLFTSKNTAEVKAYNVEIGKVFDTLTSTHGTMDQLEAKANAVGLSFKDNIGQQGKAGLEAVKTLAEEFTRRWDELNESIATTRGELDGLIQRGNDLGFEFDAQGNLVRVNFAKMSEAAQRYGIDIGTLGQTFQAQRLHASAEEIINDFELLTRGGADVGGVLAGMKDEINALVNDSIKFGTDIPENMRPWIENLIETGQLTDANGQKITDLAGLQFGESIATQFESISTQLKEVVTKLGELIAQLSQSLTPALDNAMRDRTARFRFDVDEPPDIDWGGGSRGGFARGTFGRLGVDFPDFGSGREVIVHGREAIVPFEARESAARRWLGVNQAPAAAAERPIVVNTYIAVDPMDGRARQISESEYRQIQSRLQSGELQVPARAITQRGR